MAQLTSPPIDWGGAAPQAESVVVSAALIAPNSVVVYTDPILVVPRVGQLAAPAPIPDAGLFVWQRSVVDSAGNILTDARVDVRHAETNAVANLWADREGTTQKQNPFLVDSEGFARFYAQAGLYKITASRAGLERIFENVILGIRLEDLPADLSTILAPLIEDVLAPELAALENQLAALPTVVSFRTNAAGGGVGLPAGYACARLGVGYYRLTHNAGTMNYHPKLTVWDPSGDRVFSAMLFDKQTNYFEFRVRSIFDVASNTDADVNVELTF